MNFLLRGPNYEVQYRGEENSPLKQGEYGGVGGIGIVPKK